ncbi:MAG: ABC transporter permease [Candidatus Woesearchaeota archaeon]|jgi:ABC-2 type transport system permease protein|nr:ABC transporter permease [Candidatus Woesearchaeota archaeon]MDP6265562.1 ABC transporter permease [Candidatus Woesearchaeota archaeon]MDP7322646.1 ABC transporter permease [Candidatus Woesearchaeota archaeon]MDP7476665.1 ABC transporter permease [Candidatus Woesearchaeota archaeon]HJO02034.1 ABC transporter permease [Candidatus Woesearchaeota archaeon]|tara:strand:+ start:1136 stop:1900 length:765 start_codon:yes stop_codon:yes gene_type:complete
MANFIGFYTLTKREILRFLKVWTMTILPTWITTLLYLIIFGFTIGRVLPQIGNTSYLEFIIPGILMMGLITTTYANNSTSIFMFKWLNYIEGILIAPLSYIETVTAFILGGIVRGLIIAASVYIISLFFYSGSIFNPLLFVFLILVVSLIFSSLGLITGLWAEDWDQLNIWSTFIITPLVFLGGVFHSITLVPESLQIITRINPIFYMIDAFRYSMIGVSESNLFIGFFIISILAVSLFFFAVYLFRIGYKIRK